jgi:hypothetical protein
MEREVSISEFKSKLERQESQITHILNKYDSLLESHKSAIEAISMQENRIKMLTANIDQKNYSKSVKNRTLSKRMLLTPDREDDN